MALILVGVNSGYDDPVGQFYNIEIYWDDVAKERVEVPTGYTPTNQTSAEFDEGEVIDSYCIGSTLIEILPFYVNGVTNGDIAEPRSTQDSPFCTITPCTLGASTSVTDETAQNADDGEVEFTVSNPDYPVDFRIYAGDFEDTAQIGSGTTQSFTGLAPGVYNYSVTDETGCVVTGTFTVNAFAISGEYEVKYRADHRDMDNTLHRVDIEELGFTGDLTEVNSGDTPLVIQKEGDENNKFLPVQAMSLNIALSSPTSDYFSSLFNQDERKFRVKYYRGGTLKLVTYLLGDQLVEPYTRSGNYEVNFVATDALGTLKDEPFTYPNGNRYSGQWSFIEIIAEILGKLEFDLEIWTTVLRYADGMDTSLCPLAQAEFDVFAYYKQEDNFTPSCYDVLTAILQDWGCELYQWNGRWNIRQCKIELGTAANYKRRKFSAAGVYDSSDTYNAKKVLTSGSVASPIVWTGSNAQKSNVPAYRVSQISFDMGPRKNLIGNGNFDNWANDTAVLDWTIIGDIEKETVTDDISRFGLKILHPQQYNNLAYYAHQEFDFTDTANTKLAIRARFKCNSPNVVVEGEHSVTVYGNNLGIITVIAFEDENHGYSTNEIIEVKGNEALEGIYRVEVMDQDNYMIRTFTPDARILYGGPYNGSITVNKPSVSAKTAIEVRLVGTTDYYLTNKGGWRAAYNKIEIPINKLNDWQTFSIVTNALPSGDYTVYIRLFNLQFTGDEIEDVDGVIWSNVAALYYPQGLAPEKIETVQATQAGRFTFKTNEITLHHGDIPGGDNGPNVYLNAIIFDGLPTSSWARDGVTEDKSFQQCLGQEQMNQYATPSLKFNGTLLVTGGAEMEMDSLPEDPNQVDKLFKLDRTNVNTKKNMWNTCLLEIK